MTVREYFESKDFDYHAWEVYDNLSDLDQQIFDRLYHYIVSFKKITMSDAEIAKLVGAPVSTLEKSLKRLEANQLISRNCQREKNSHGLWRTVSRTITLNPFYFPGYDGEGTTFEQRAFNLYLELQKCNEVIDRILDMDFNEFVQMKVVKVTNEKISM